MADNTCHFGVNNFFADNGLGDVESFLYFPADGAQMIAVVKRVFFERGVRFVFSTRSKVPYLLKEDGSRFYDDSYEFVPGKDEVLIEGSAGYIVTFGEMVYRAWDAVLRLRKEGINVGLINKPTLNIIDEAVLTKAGKSGFVLVVESQNQRTGLGSRYGTWLLERGLTPKYAYLGAVKEGCGGLTEQIPYQGLAPTGMSSFIFCPKILLTLDDRHHREGQGSCEVNYVEGRRLSRYIIIGVRLSFACNENGFVDCTYSIM
jgi:hypothetical protein